MLRSYDPQIGRFLQYDPYSQFASGYVGMGNDPGSMVDPTGGFSGPGTGCAVTAGMVGYGGMAAGNAARGISTTVTTIAQVANIAMTGAGLVNAISSSGKSLSSIVATKSSGVYNSGGSTNAATGNADDEDGGKNPCNCPDGYSNTPKPGGDPRPYFLSPNDAARYWAFKHRDFAIATTREYSSELFSFKVRSGNSIVTLFGSTNSVHFLDLSKAYSFSPGVGDPLHEKRPNGSVIVGHIHYHWHLSHEKGRGTRSDNRTFSEPDKGIHKFHREKYFYVLGSTGILYVKYPENMPLQDGWGNMDEGEIKPLEGGFYERSKKQPQGLCPCYKQ